MQYWVRTFSAVFVGIIVGLVLLSLLLSGCATLTPAQKLAQEQQRAHVEAEVTSVLADIRDAAADGAVCAPGVIAALEDAIAQNYAGALLTVWNAYQCIKQAVTQLMADIKARKAALPELAHAYEVKLVHSLARQSVTGGK